MPISRSNFKKNCFLYSIQFQVRELKCDIYNIILDGVIKKKRKNSLFE